MSKPDFNGDLLAQNAALSIKLEQVQKDADESKTRADAAEGKLAALQADHAKLQDQVRADAAESPVKLKEQMRALHQAAESAREELRQARSDEAIDKRVRERVSVERRAATVLGGDPRFDGMTTRQVKTMAIARLYGAGKDLDDAGQPRADAYIDAMFDRGTEGFEQANAAIARIRDAATPAPESRADARSEYAQFQDRMANKWRASGARKDKEVK